jgi:F0F1-type ATP synthase alpha subunit
MFVSIEVALKDEKKKLKDYMNTNNEAIDLFSQYLNGNKNMIIGKARQTGRSNVASHLMDWKKLYDKHERVRLRKETIKRLFNI